MRMSPASRCGAIWAMAWSTTPAGIISQIARGLESLLVRSSAEEEPVTFFSLARSATICGVRRDDAFVAVYVAGGPCSIPFFRVQPFQVALAAPSEEVWFCCRRADGILLLRCYRVIMVFSFAAVLDISGFSEVCGNFLSPAIGPYVAISGLHSNILKI